MDEGLLELGRWDFAAPKAKSSWVYWEHVTAKWMDVSFNGAGKARFHKKCPPHDG